MGLKGPPLPPVTSWYPGHMASFSKNLPQLLQNTHVVLETRDARLPLSSINPHFENLLNSWYSQRGRGIIGPVERIVIYNKADLVPKWGVEPFRRALSKHVNHETFFTTTKQGKTIGELHKKLVAIAQQHRQSASSLNVLVVGMPNVGKSTILNQLRVYGIKGAASSALRTSRLPGMTRTTSTRLKLSEDPLIYSIDSPGVMIPFLGYGDEARELAVKLSLLLGIRESLFDYEHLAAYLLYRLNSTGLSKPPYPPILANPTRTRGCLPLTESIDDFLIEMAERMGYLLPGGIADKQRAAKWFVEWWRNSAAEGPQGGAPEWGWGLDFQWNQAYNSLETTETVSSETALIGESTAATSQDDSHDLHEPHESCKQSGMTSINSGDLNGSLRTSREGSIEEKFEDIIRRYFERMRHDRQELSQTQSRKVEKEEVNKKRMEKREEIERQRMAGRRLRGDRKIGGNR